MTREVTPTAVRALSSDEVDLICEGLRMLYRDRLRRVHEKPGLYTPAELRDFLNEILGIYNVFGVKPE